jgi:hypothetical protein
MVDGFDFGEEPFKRRVFSGKRQDPDTHRNPTAPPTPSAFTQPLDIEVTTVPFQQLTDSSSNSNNISYS